MTGLTECKLQGSAFSKVHQLHLLQSSNVELQQCRGCPGVKSTVGVTVREKYLENGKQTKQQGKGHKGGKERADDLAEGSLVAHNQVVMGDEDVESALLHLFLLQLLALVWGAIIHDHSHVWRPLGKLLTPIGQHRLRRVIGSAETDSNSMLSLCCCGKIQDCRSSSARVMHC